MISTRFTRLVGCPAPVQVAPMGPISSPALIVAAAEAGALPMIGTAGMGPADAIRLVKTVRDTVAGPVGANMLIPFFDRSVVEAIAPLLQVFDFYHGDPDRDAVALVHDAGCLAAWQVGSRAAAVAAVAAGCDLLAVRGVEGGGRMHGTQPLWPLLNAVLDAVDVPVLAAGGLATARDLAAVLAAGADGARLGTRFVATDESGAHPVYKDAIVAADGDDTALVTDFSVLWPDGPEPHRVLRRSLEAAAAVAGDVVGETRAFGERRAVPKYAIVPPAADATGEIEAFAMYAGVSAGAIDRIEPAGEVIRRLVTGAEELLRRGSTMVSDG